MQINFGPVPSTGDAWPITVDPDLGACHSFLGPSVASSGPSGLLDGAFQTFLGIAEPFPGTNQPLFGTAHPFRLGAAKSAEKTTIP